MNFSNNIKKHNVEEVLDLSPMQEGMFYHYLKSPNTQQYHEQLSLHISKKVDIDIFQKGLVVRHRI